MQFITTFHNLKTLFLRIIDSRQTTENKVGQNINSLSFIFLGMFIVTTITVWIVGPYISWGNYAPLAQPEKRIYCILFIFLAWLLKYIIVDLDVPDPAKYEDKEIQKKLYDLQRRFRGAVEFLNKTRILRNNKSTRLIELPWYLLLGPAGAGKSSLLAKSEINFILQRRQRDAHKMEATKHYDWWVTRDTTIIDVPGKYLSRSSAHDAKNYSILWQFFLRLIKKLRGRAGINGIIIALPLPELLQSGDNPQYQTLLHNLFSSITELKKIFSKPIPCQIVITKCDLLPGFAEFFADAGKDEITQTWNVTLTPTNDDESPADIFAHRFDALIKKLNQQLIWRLHRERDPMTRPYIKDFPLQIELIKEFTKDFINKISAAEFSLDIKDLYLTSALQEKSEAEINNVEEDLLEVDNIELINITERAVQIYQEQAPASRAYFIKQFISHGLGSTGGLASQEMRVWKQRAAYASSFGILGLTAILVGHDFKQGIKQAHSVEANLADYQLTVKQIQDPDEHLIKTTQLLTTLQPEGTASGYKLDLSHLLSFYSQKSQQKTFETYQQALRTILLPEIKNYLSDYLTMPVNKNPEYVYASLKAYLMLGDSAHFQADYITNTLREILPKDMNPNDAAQLFKHVNVALNSAWSPLQLDTNVIEQTRRFCINMPGYQLAYIILKNINSNNNETEINLGTNDDHFSAFITLQKANHIPNMFTAKAFSTVVNQDSLTAAQESLMGNWVLGNITNPNRNPELVNGLVEQLRTVYLTNYIAAWEKFLANTNVSKPADLIQTDKLIIDLISNNSPLLQLLQTLHENTYFEPIASSSPKLQNLGLLLENRNQTENQLYQIFSGLQYLHEYLRTVLNAQNEQKAAFAIVSNRMLNHGTPDAIMQLRKIAAKSPEPIENWLDAIANHALHLLMQDASNYIDTSWQDQVIKIYQTKIADRYPFNINTQQDVAIQNFVAFFGNPGIIPNFFHNYLRPFVDLSTSEWHWRTFDDVKMPFSDEVLRQIQQAMRIHHTFFPKGDNQLSVQFALQPYLISNKIKSIKLNINDKQFTYEQGEEKTPQMMAWSNTDEPKKSSVQLTFENKTVINHDFPGDWGWFKLINQSFENMINKKEVVINLSKNEQPAKYLLVMHGQNNAFLTLNLNHFHLPQQINIKG